MKKSDLQARLIKTFLAEMDDHVATFNDSLPQLEQETSAARRAELLRAPFRAAHSLKGAARSVGQPAIENCCQHLESLFETAQSRGSNLDDDLFRRLYAAVDALDAFGRAIAADQVPDAQLTRLGQATDGLAAAAVALQRTREMPESRSAADVPAAPSPAAEPVAAESLRPLGDYARVPRDKLERLLSASGQLHVARMRSHVPLDDIDRLKAFVQEWRQAWSRASPMLARIGQEAVDGAAGGQFSGRKVRQAVQVLAESKGKLDKIERSLDDIRMQLTVDRKELEAAALPIEREIYQIRMLPFHQACDGLQRVVRDLASAHGRSVALVVKGRELELDRSILESLRPPLLQLIRNAVHHGIEKPEERKQAAKDPQGQIVISAAIEGNRAQITVEDDGRGLDFEMIADRARLKGLTIPSDREALADLIFEPGVSTAPSVTPLAGRGIGLDIVKSTVTALRGTVGVSSHADKGTRFTMSLPLQLSGFTALLIRIGDARFAVDLGDVTRVLQVAFDDIIRADGRQFIIIGSRQVPLMFMSDLLDMGGEALPTDGRSATAVVLATGGRKAAFFVDEVLGDQDVMVKPLGERLEGVRSVAGGTVLSDGGIALVLNADQILNDAAEAPAHRIRPDLTGSASVPRKRLLVVEDSATTRMLEVNVLESSGYAVEAAVDGAEAWEMLQKIEVDLIVSDVEMPRMNGFQLTKQIRSDARTREIPVILLTAREAEDDKLRGMRAGADAYLIKSAFDQSMLIETIERLLP